MSKKIRNKIKNSAWELVAEYGATRPLELSDLSRICKEKNWRLCPYEDNLRLIKALGLERFMYQHAFNYLDKDNETFFIFYNARLSEIEQMKSILHEIAHYDLKHDLLGVPSPVGIKDWRDKECEAYAYEAILPTLILNPFSFSKEDLCRNFKYMDTDWIDYAYEQQYSDDNACPEIEYAITKNFKSFVNDLAQQHQENFINRTIQRKKKLFLFYSGGITAVLLSIVLFSIFLSHLSQKSVPVQPSFSSKISDKKIEDEITKINFSPSENSDLSEIESKEKNTKENTVYITKSGKKYHNATCRYIQDKNNIISLSEKAAQELSMEPCSVCRPNEKAE